MILSSFSISSTLMPYRPRVLAIVRPTGPAPTMATSWSKAVAAGGVTAGAAALRALATRVTMRNSGRAVREEARTPRRLQPSRGRAPGVAMDRTVLAAGQPVHSVHPVHSKPWVNPGQPSPSDGPPRPPARRVARPGLQGS